MTEPVLKIGTRGSALALAQTGQVAASLNCPTELVVITTHGDRAGGSLTGIGGKGLFTAELEDALRAGQVQLAVHSAKDLPTEVAADFVIGAVPVRQDPRDVLLSVDGGSLADLPRGARVGTSSLRRAAQVLAVRPDAIILPVRGNIDTRIRKLRDGEYDAILLAMAGLNRLCVAADLAGMIYGLSVEAFVPAAGQGCLALECLAGDARTRGILAAVNDADSAEALAAERAVLAELAADCRSALGVHVRRSGQEWQGLAMAARPNGTEMIRLEVLAPSAAAAGEQLIQRLVRAGARAVLNENG